jgi:hypothetical protein
MARLAPDGQPRPFREWSLRRQEAPACKDDHNDSLIQ